MNYPAITYNINTSTKNSDQSNSLIKSLLAGISFEEYESGTKLKNGMTVRSIVSRSPIHVVYTVHGSQELSCEYAMINDEIQNSVNKLTYLLLEAKEKFKGTAVIETNNQAILIFNLIFWENSKVEEYFEKFEQYIKNRPPITEVLSSSENYIVWINHRKEPEYLSWAPTDKMHGTISEYVRLRALGLSFIPKKLQQKFSSQLGAALVTAFEKGKDNPAVFKESESLISKIIENSLRTKYTLTTATTSMALILITTIFALELATNQTEKMVALAICGGVIGAFISIQERAKFIKCQISDPIKTIIFQATIRIVLGGTFGFIAFILSILGIFFNTFKDNLFSMLLIGIISGFSERLIPEVLENMIKKKPASAQNITQTQNS